ncbi:MAG: 4-hydroxy-tetrahydrodipicolinate synthase [Fusobacteriaceae bacterium]
MEIFTGSGVALVTPLDKNNKVDYNKLKELLEFHVKNLTDAIIVTGTTGESSTMTEEEQLEIIRFSVETVGGRVPVIAGTGSNNTAHAVELSKKAESLGVDGLLIVTPYYNKGNESGLIHYFKSVAEAVKCPIILYNVPGRTGVNLSFKVLEELEKVSNIVGIKEAGGNISYVAEIARCFPKLSIYSGNDDMVVPVLSLGGKGVISVCANILPQETHNIVHYYLNGETAKATELQLRYNELINCLFIETNPVPIKSAMNILGYGVGSCRSPLQSMEKLNFEKLEKLLKKYEVARWI